MNDANEIIFLLSILADDRHGNLTSLEDLQTILTKKGVIFDYSLSGEGKGVLFLADGSSLVTAEPLGE